MNSDRVFPTTLWTTVLKAGRGDTGIRRTSLERLCRRYWPPALHYLRAIDRTLNESDAQDLIQDFFTRLIEKESLARLSPERGSFRGFLKQSLRNFAVDAHRRRKTRKAVPLDEHLDAAETEAVFDREWDRTVLQGALEELERRLAKASLEKEWRAFQIFCLGESRPSYRDLAARLHVTESQVRKGLFRARNELREILTERVREYALDEEEAGVELKRIIGSTGP